MAKVRTDHDLVKSLFQLQKKHSKLVRSTVYDAPEDTDIKVRSWKMSEQHYYTVPSPFPTLARGIFTTWVGNGQAEDAEGSTGHYRIVARGYDKFFNMGEVPWTTWDAIKKHTQPPYALTVKSNGCIIFIAALTPEKLLITSKHAIGWTHSDTGNIWLDKHVKSVGRTRQEFAKVLWKNNWTAVAELCDDSFEEHVLAYPPEQTGLHLHGLNVSGAQFETIQSSPPDNDPKAISVEGFAKEWGFIQTASFLLPSIEKVKELTDKCQETGSWNGEPIEGFVIRTTVREADTHGENKDGDASITIRKGDTRSSRDAPPYPPGSGFFFKVKFDEPYMMYRDWREITKAYLSAYDKSGKSALSTSKASKNRMKRAETRIYDEWVRREIIDDPGFFEGYQQNKGIVKTRQRFLDWLASSDGAHRLKKEQGSRSRSPSPVRNDKQSTQKLEKQKVIIVPVAIPGCGKTTVAIALKKLFGFHHTQSDDVVAKSKKMKKAAIFENSVNSLLRLSDNAIVIADKNNHLTQHRTALRHLLPNANPPVRLIALNWSPASKSNAELHQICGARILSRGENHQSLRGDPEEVSAHETVLWQFINTSDELAEGEVDDIIEMDIADSVDASVRRAVTGLCKLLPSLKVPSEEAILEAVKAAEAYAVPLDKRQESKPADKKKPKHKGPPRYFAIVPYTADNKPLDMQAFVDKLVSRLPTDQEPTSKLLSFWDTLKKHNRVTPTPHVTVVHKKSVELGRDGEIAHLWPSCLKLTSEPPVTFRIDHFVFSETILALALEVGSLASVEGGSDDIIKLIPPGTVKRLHFTVATKDASVAPVQAGEMVLRWRSGKLAKDEHAIKVPGASDDLSLTGKLEGLWG